jgi:hypothetical protein
LIAPTMHLPLPLVPAFPSMHRRRAARARAATALPVTLALALLVAAGAPAQAGRRQPPSHPDRGLPVPGAVWAPYHADAEHVLNRVFRACYVVHGVPTEVAAALPREHDGDAFFAPGWYFGKRAGTHADARWFGGDARQLPREEFPADEARAFAADLARVDGDVAAALRARPALAVWFQHDLLRMARRLLDTKRNGELLGPLLAAARAVALPAAMLRDPALGTFALDELRAAGVDVDAAALTEIERRSSRLFDAETTQLWSSVHVALPAGSGPDVTGWLAAARDAGKNVPPLPLGTLAVLVQGIVALDDAGVPRATDLVIEVRTQRLVNRDALAAGNRTTTRDGVDFAIWSLERETLRTRGARAAFADFRRVDLEDQELFRDYGTRKHTTIAAQCTLCHRRSNAPDEPLAGFSALRSSAAPRPVTDAGERRRRAEVEMAKFAAVLLAAAATAGGDPPR